MLKNKIGDPLSVKITESFRQHPEILTLEGKQPYDYLVRPLIMKDKSQRRK